MKRLFLGIIVICGVFLSCTNTTIDSESVISDTEQDSRAIWSVSGSTFTHDPSIIYESSSNLYWMFYTADGIGVKYSSDGKNWRQGVQVLPSALPWWSTYVPGKTDFNIWAPEIVYYNGYYYLYYSVSTFGSKVSCIGLLRATSILTGDWTDMGMVIRSTASSAYNCIDPGFIYAGAPFLTFGSWSDGIYMVRLSSATMKPNASAFQIADRDLSSNAVEGACVWAPGNGYFYLFASYDVCCAGTNSTYNIRYGRSSVATGTYTDKNGISMKDNGGTVLIGTGGNRVGPGGQCVFRTREGGWAMAYHYYDAANNGTATLEIRDLKTVSGWPSF